MDSRFVDVSGLRTHYLVAGEAGEAEPVILLHGFPQTSHEWRAQLPVLANAGHPVYAPDTRGFGRTGKPRIRVSRAMLADDVVRFCDAVGINTATLVGHDWGGVIAFKAAIDHPERFRRLGVLDAPCTVYAPQIVHPYWYKVAPLPEAFFATHARDFIEVRFGGRDPAVLGDRPGNPFGFMFPSGAQPRPSWIDDEALDNYIDSFSDPDAQFAAIQYYRYAMPFHRVIADPDAPGGERYELLSEADVASMWLHPDGFEAHPWASEYVDFAPEDRHKRFRGPALFVYSQVFQWLFPHHADGVAPRGTPFADQYGRYLPYLRVRSAECGHFIPEEAPDLVNDAVLELLATKV